MKTIKRFRGAQLKASKNGALYAVVPYRGTYPVAAGDVIYHGLGKYIVTGHEALKPGGAK